ncbi:TetR/AcrR family transcriptional regulator [Pseudomonas sp. TWI929]|uniref:TetR/AcrR family transcriptional regulator n=1 Tax=Pseudomonas sp. TWI929 TaxID=3136795 RepID=UPI0032094561
MTDSSKTKNSASEVIWSGTALHIIKAAAKIIQEDGISKATMRNIASSAEIQPPQIYSHIGDRDKLLEAVAIYLWTEHHSTTILGDDPVTDFHHAIDKFIYFGLSHSELYLYVSRPRQGAGSRLWSHQSDFLRFHLNRIAKARRLRGSVSQAVDFLLPFCIGTTITCMNALSQPSDLSWLVMKAVQPLIVRDKDHPIESQESMKASALAAALATSMNEMTNFTLGEKILFKELLTRLASS